MARDSRYQRFDTLCSPLLESGTQAVHFNEPAREGEDREIEDLVKRMCRLSVHEESYAALYVFGFLDPAQVIRGVHLIPNFPRGRTDSRLPPSIVRPVDDDHEDWDSFDMNM
jgi:hypothetical protein